jgi:hypothetical protein
MAPLTAQSARKKAMLSKRHYKEEGTALKALQVLALHAKQGLIQDYIAYLWIADEMLNLDMGRLNATDRGIYAALAASLDTSRNRHLAWPNWRVQNNVDVQKMAA